MDKIYQICGVHQKKPLTKGWINVLGTLEFTSSIFVIISGNTYSKILDGLVTLVSDPHCAKSNLMQVLVTEASYFGQRKKYLSQKNISVTNPKSLSEKNLPSQK